MRIQESSSEAGETAEMNTERSNNLQWSNIGTTSQKNSGIISEGNLLSQLTDSQELSPDDEIINISSDSLGSTANEISFQLTLNANDSNIEAAQNAKVQDAKIKSVDDFTGGDVENNVKVCEENESHDVDLEITGHEPATETVLGLSESQWASVFHKKQASFVKELQGCSGSLSRDTVKDVLNAWNELNPDHPVSLSDQSVNETHDMIAKKPDTAVSSVKLIEEYRSTITKPSQNLRLVPVLKRTVVDHGKGQGNIETNMDEMAAVAIGSQNDVTQELDKDIGDLTENNTKESLALGNDILGVVSPLKSCLKSRRTRVPKKKSIKFGSTEDSYTFSAATTSGSDSDDNIPLQQIAENLNQSNESAGGSTSVSRVKYPHLYPPPEDTDIEMTGDQMPAGFIRFARERKTTTGNQAGSYDYCIYR